MTHEQMPGHWSMSRPPSRDRARLAASLSRLAASSVTRAGKAPPRADSPSSARAAVTSRPRVQRSRTATGGASGIRTATSSSRHGSSRRMSPWHTRSAMNPPPRPAGHGCARWRAGRSSPGSSRRKRSRQPCRSVRGAEQKPAVSARSVAQRRGHDPRRGCTVRRGWSGPTQPREMLQPASPFGR